MLNKHQIKSASGAAIKPPHDSEAVLELDATDARFFIENLAMPLESPEKEAPNLYRAIKRNENSGSAH